MKWVTRERPNAEIRYVPPAQVFAVAQTEGAIPLSILEEIGK